MAALPNIPKVGDDDVCLVSGKVVKDLMKYRLKGSGSVTVNDKLDGSAVVGLNTPLQDVDIWVNGIRMVLTLSGDISPA